MVPIHLLKQNLYKNYFPLKNYLYVFFSLYHDNHSPLLLNLYFLLFQAYPILYNKMLPHNQELMYQILFYIYFIIINNQLFKHPYNHLIKHQIQLYPIPSILIFFLITLNFL